MRRLMVIAAALWSLAGVARASGDDAEAWLRELVTVPKLGPGGVEKARIATNGDVFLAAALISDDKTWRQDAAWARKVCDRRGYVRDKPKRGLEGPAHRGYAASVFARLLDIEGGVWARVFDQTPRYAYRELVVLGMIAPGGADNLLTTEELASLLIAAERYRKVGPERLPQRGITQ